MQISNTNNQQIKANSICVPQIKSIWRVIQSPSFHWPILFGAFLGFSSSLFLGDSLSDGRRTSGSWSSYGGQDRTKSCGTKTRTSTARAFKSELFFCAFGWPPLLGKDVFVLIDTSGSMAGSVRDVFFVWMVLNRMYDPHASNHWLVNTKIQFWLSLGIDLYAFVRRRPKYTFFLVWFYCLCSETGASNSRHAKAPKAMPCPWQVGKLTWLQQNCADRFACGSFADRPTLSMPLTSCQQEVSFPIFSFSRLLFLVRVRFLRFLWAVSLMAGKPMVSFRLRFMQHNYLGGTALYDSIQWALQVCFCCWCCYLV